MKLAACLALPLLVGASTSAVTPVQKVITLLYGMLEKGKQEKHDEEVQFAEYKQFCDDTSSSKSRDIKVEGEAIDMFTAEVGKYTSDASRLGKEVQALQKDEDVWKGDIKAATKVRDIEKADYESTHKEYSESIDAIQQAVAMLERQMHDRPQAEALAQMPMKRLSALKDYSIIPEAAKRTIDVFLSQAQDPDEGYSPEANAYEFQSHGIIDMLEKLQDKFVDERAILEKEETSARHAYSMLMQDLKAQIEEAEADEGEKTGDKAKALSAKADSNGDLVFETDLKNDDNKYLGSLTSECKSKASEFEARQEMRGQEISAIEKAVEILSSESVSGNAEKHLPALLQKKTALLQLRGDGQNPTQWKAQFYVAEQAKQLKSRVLSMVAMHMQEDPFNKVKKMLKDLIVRLMEEANEEAEHKGWCDTELQTNEQTRKAKTQGVETLHAEIDELQASLSELGEDISGLSQAVSELDAAMAQSTDVRQKEKAENEATVTDAQEAQTALAQAMVVLKDFYAKSSETAALLQSKQPMTAESGGVIGLLEVIESDFARLEAETSAGEATAQKTYDNFMTESKVSKASKSTAVEHKQAKKQNMQQELNEKTSDLEGTQKLLDAALAYYDKLKPSCVDSGTSYEERVARRKQELESLQEGLRILNGEDLA